jgi:hypothetical protein
VSCTIKKKKLSSFCFDADGRAVWFGFQAGRGRVYSKRNNICKVISYNVVDERRRLQCGLVFHVTARTGFVKEQKQMKATVRSVHVACGS